MHRSATGIALPSTNSRAQKNKSSWNVCPSPQTPPPRTEHGKPPAEAGSPARPECMCLKAHPRIKPWDWLAHSQNCVVVNLIIPPLPTRWSWTGCLTPPSKSIGRMREGTCHPSVVSCAFHMRKSRCNVWKFNSPVRMIRAELGVCERRRLCDHATSLPDHLETSAVVGSSILFRSSTPLEGREMAQTQFSHDFVTVPSSPQPTQQPWSILCKLQMRVMDCGNRSDNRN